MKVDTTDLRGSLEIHTTDDVSTARVTLPTPLGERTYIGGAKRHPKDRPDSTIGELLAMSRALAKAAEDLEDESLRRIDVADLRRRQLDWYADAVRRWSPPGSGTKGLLEDIAAVRRIPGIKEPAADPLMDLWMQHLDIQRQEREI